MAVGKNIRGVGKGGRKFWRKKSRFKIKNGGGKEYKVVGNFIHPFKYKSTQANMANMVLTLLLMHRY